MSNAILDLSIISSDYPIAKSLVLQSSFSDHLPILLELEVLDMHAPLKTVRIKNNLTPWITQSIRDEMDRRDRVCRFYRQNPSPTSKNIYRAQCNLVVWLQREAKYDYFHRLFQKIHNLQRFGILLSLLNPRLLLVHGHPLTPILSQ